MSRNTVNRLKTFRFEQKLSIRMRKRVQGETSPDEEGQEGSADELSVKVLLHLLLVQAVRVAAESSTKRQRLPTPLVCTRRHWRAVQYPAPAGVMRGPAGSKQFLLPPRNRYAHSASRDTRVSPALKHGATDF